MWSVCLSVCARGCPVFLTQPVSVRIITDVANRKSTWRRSAVVSKRLPVASHTVINCSFILDVMCALTDCRRTLNETRIQASCSVPQRQQCCGFILYISHCRLCPRQGSVSESFCYPRHTPQSSITPTSLRIRAY